jgi:Secretion system C-terminal sorting domain
LGKLFFVKLNRIKMKKICSTLALFLSCSLSIIYAQNDIQLNSPQSPSIEYQGAEMDATLKETVKYPKYHFINPNQPETMFDVQFILRPNDSLLYGSPRRTYGVLWTGTEFWMAQWTSDTIVRFNQNGNRLGFLKVENLPVTTGNRGVRGLTTEGTNIWAVNFSDSILRLDPATGQILQKIGGPVIGGLRFVTWDPTEGGGFWVGGFSSDLYKISKTGAVIRTIPRSVHGLLSMAGAAYDSVSVGGPYLWMNCQTDFAGTGVNSAIVRQVKLSNGFGTSIVRNVKVDVPAMTIQNLGGGATIATLPGFSKPSLMMVVQNVPDFSGVVIGYELNFVQPNSVDVGLDSLDVANGFTIMPLRHKNVAALKAKARNIGFANATNVSLLTEMYRGFDFITSQTSTASVPALSYQSFNVLNSYIPTDTGSYTAFLYARTTGDPNTLNDTAQVYFAIRDSTYATDNVETPGVGSTSLSIGAGNGLPEQKRLGMTYRLPVASSIKSVTIRFRPQVSGDTVQIKIYKMVNGQVGDSIAASPIYVTTKVDSAALSTEGVVRTLALKTPLSIAANEEFLICLAEGRGGLRLFSTTRGYRPKTMWAYGNFWVNTDTFTNPAFRAALYLRPNVTIRVGQNDLMGNISEVKAYPNPMSDVLTVSIKLTETDVANVVLFDLTGKQIFKENIGNSKYFEKSYPLSNLPAGMYILTVSTPKGSWQEKIIKQ